MLSLYTKATCPYCHKVIDFAQNNHVALDLKDIYLEPTNKQDLIERGGKRQVPYLVDTDRQVEMYESDDIVAYLKSNYVDRGEAP
jgi:glutaredoxin 3